MEILRNLGLKSFLEIEEKYAKQKRHISKKKVIMRGKSGMRFSQLNKSRNSEKRQSEINLNEKAHYYGQDMVLEELRRLTGLVGKLERKMGKVAKNLDRWNKLENRDRKQD